MEHLQDKTVRVEAMRESFPLFFSYHFGWDEWVDFQMDWMESMQSLRDVMIVWFRASRKTTMVRWYIVRCVLYKIHESIVWQSYEDTSSKESVRSIAKMLTKDSVVADYWHLFPFETKKEDLSKRWMSNFETTNGVKVESKSLWQTLRWANTYDSKSWISARPTLLVLDDIDVVKSVNNVDIINANERKILGETIPALDPLKRKVIFLGNVIAQDGIVPRFRENYENEEWWDCYRQPLFYEDGTNARPEVFTDEVIAKLRADGKTSFNQNYLLIPSTIGSGIFMRAYFDYYLESEFENPESFLKKEDATWWISIDPAFSTSKKSDDAAVVLVGKHLLSNKYYLHDWYSDKSAPSATISAVIVMYNKAVQSWYKIAFISVEDVKINKRQTKFIEDLREELRRHEIHCPLLLFKPKLQKNIRIQDQLETVMSQKWLKTNKSMPDKTFINKMERQFLEFPVGDHDDIPDVLAQSMIMHNRKHWQSKKKEQKPIVSAITRKSIRDVSRSRRWRPTTNYWSYSWLSWRPLSS